MRPGPPAVRGFVALCVLRDNGPQRRTTVGSGKVGSFPPLGPRRLPFLAQPGALGLVFLSAVFPPRGWGGGGSLGGWGYFSALAFSERDVIGFYVGELFSLVLFYIGFPPPLRTPFLEVLYDLFLLAFAFSRAPFPPFCPLFPTGCPCSQPGYSKGILGDLAREGRMVGYSRRGRFQPHQS